MDIYRRCTIFTDSISEGGNAIASVRLFVSKVKVLGQANAVGPTSISGSFFLVSLFSLASKLSCFYVSCLNVSVVIVIEGRCSAVV